MQTHLFPKIISFYWHLIHWLLLKILPSGQTQTVPFQTNPVSHFIQLPFDKYHPFKHTQAVPFQPELVRHEVQDFYCK